LEPTTGPNIWVKVDDFQIIVLIASEKGVLDLITPDKALPVPSPKALELELFLKALSPPAKRSSREYRLLGR
jgi:hypothetical protein